MIGAVFLFLSNKDLSPLLSLILLDLSSQYPYKYIWQQHFPGHLRFMSFKWLLSGTRVFCLQPAFVTTLLSYCFLKVHLILSHVVLSYQRVSANCLGRGGKHRGKELLAPFGVHVHTHLETQSQTRCSWERPSRSSSPTIP